MKFSLTRAWTAAGVGSATAVARVRCLRSALSWAYREGILDAPPLRGLRGPSTATIRLHAPVDAVCLANVRRRSIAASRSCSWRGWQPTPAPGAANWLPYSSTT